MLIGIILSFFLTFISLPIMIKVAESNKLFVPTNYRKLHTGNTSALGGLVIFFSTLVSFILFSDVLQIANIKYFLSSAILLAVIGLYDDLHEVKAIYKLAGQILAVGFLTFTGDVHIEFIQNHLPGYNGVILDQFLSLFLMVTIINAYNLIDGVDWLASMVASVLLLCLGLWFYLAQQHDSGLLLLSLGASLIAFMIFNFPPAKIFMGDTGTMTIGLIIAIALIQFEEVNPDINLRCHVNSAAGIAFSFVGFLFFDLIRVSVLRLIEFKSPFRADRIHIHHRLLEMGYNPVQISLIISVFILSQIVISFITDKVFDVNSIIIIAINLLLICAFYFCFLFVIKVKKRDSTN